MNEVIAIDNNRIVASSERSIANVKKLAEELRKLPQVSIETGHMVHGGMYARTLRLLPQTVIAGALAKLATILIINGHVLMYSNEKAIELKGYNVFAASAFRKQAFVALSEVSMTMIFPTKLSNLDDIEKEITDENDELLSRIQDTNTITMTGE